MTESTRVSQQELERREKCLRAYNRPYKVWDPYTWSYPAKSALMSFGFTFGAMYLYNLWSKKPWYWGAYARGAGLIGCTIGGYAMGSLRAYNYRTRDAVIDHYMELHPNDFERVQDFYGRPFSQILMPWIPIRTYQWDFTIDKEN